MVTKSIVHANKEKVGGWRKEERGNHTFVSTAKVRNERGREFKIESMNVCVCVCVCVSERERRERNGVTGVSVSILRTLRVKIVN